MKRVAISLILFASVAGVSAFAGLALAGQGFIEETETGFYVEYAGDAKDRAAAAEPLPHLPAAKNPPIAVASEEDQARREANEARAEARRAEARRAEAETRSRPVKSRKSRQISLPSANDE